MQDEEEEEEEEEEVKLLLFVCFLNLPILASIQISEVFNARRFARCRVCNSVTMIVAHLTHCIIRNGKLSTPLS